MLGLQEGYKYKLRVKRKMFYDEETRWGVYSFEFVDKSEVYKSGVDVHPIYRNFVISGTAPLLKEGEERLVIFKDSESDKYGKGYSFIEVVSEGLKTPEAQAEFLRQMIGNDKHYSKIIDMYPPNETYIKDLLDGKYDLKKISGIKEATEERYLNSLTHHEGYEKAIVKLAPIGVGISTIKKLVDFFEHVDVMLDVIENKIYEITKVRGFGFKKVDELALKVGYKKDEPQRIVAGASYVLEQMSENGDIKIPIEEFDVEMCKVLEISEVSDEIFHTIMSDNRFSYDSGFICLESLRLEELYIATRIATLINEATVLDGLEENKEGIIKENEAKNGFEFNKQQLSLIDNVLSQGVTVLTGAAGTGKCIKGDTLVTTSKGMIKIEDIPLYFKVNSKTDEAVAKVVSYDTTGKKYINKKTSHWFNMGYSKTKKITTSYGRIIEGTYEHPLLTMNRNTGNLEYKELKDMQVNDVVVLSKEDKIFGKDKTVNENMAWVLGVLTGDAHLNQYVRLTNQNPEIYLPFKKYLKDELNIEVKDKYCEKTGAHDHCIYKKEYYSLFEDTYKLSMVTSAHKEIPSTILQSPKRVMVKYLQGLFDTDGSMIKRVDRKGREKYYFEFCTASEIMSQQLLTVLLNFGIIVSNRVKTIKDSKGRDREYYVLTIDNRDNLMKLHKEIGFLHHSEKQRKLDIAVSFLKNETSNTNKELAFGTRKILREIHNFMRDNHGWGRYTEFANAFDNRLTAKGFNKEVSMRKIKNFSINHKDKNYPHKDFIENLVNNLHLEEVKSIENSECVVYDFTVPETHSFVANGIINHNTAVVKTVVDIFESAGHNVVAMALSGKAAQVMAENGIENSGTIHRQLKFQGGLFAYNEEEPLPYKLIIVDEASMVNNSLFASILSAIANGCRLLVIGDDAQLPPIGHGAVFSTMLNSSMPKARLTEIHRQAAKSGIITAATDIRKGKQLNKYGSNEFQVIGELKDMRIFNYVDKTLILEDIKATVKKFISNPQMNPKDLQILTAMKRGSLGVPTLNKEIQEIVNPANAKNKDEFHLVKNQELRVGDRVIQGGNLYDAEGYYSLDSYNLGEESHKTDVFNGTIGYVVKYEENGLLVRFDYYSGTEYVYYAKEDGADGRNPLGMLELAYAITTHRSQGSGFKTVLFAFDYSAYMLLSREFVYTGVTRAIDNCLMFVENTALHQAIKTTKGIDRKTFLNEYLEEELSKIQ